MKQDLATSADFAHFASIKCQVIEDANMFAVDSPYRRGSDNMLEGPWPRGSGTMS